MTISKAISLHHEWVNHRDSRFDLDRIHASMRAELAANRQWPARCTPACARETRGKLVLLGKVRKALA